MGLISVRPKIISPRARANLAFGRSFRLASAPPSRASAPPSRFRTRAAVPFHAGAVVRFRARAAVPLPRPRHGGTRAGHS
ncbi:hypothetical protein GUJ93_ZPchr0005g16197 [Zizania palustris]|uniref:Uncharacterized protein n=1 Tax=Zizania palustris TaxID=103762 RepID=A0A8J5T3J7_ZIZPA|nr:hypothetical protein GUJ93_ZPchr0005g16197 [Zizania palustris]